VSGICALKTRPTFKPSHLFVFDSLKNRAYINFIIVERNFDKHQIDLNKYFV